MKVEHRVLLTGTPLQNNITELFMLMHFLDAGKFDDPDAFEAQFAEISQDEQVMVLVKGLGSMLPCAARTASVCPEDTQMHSCDLPCGHLRSCSSMQCP